MKHTTIRRFLVGMIAGAGIAAGALFGTSAANAGSIEPTLPLVTACHESGQPADYAYIDRGDLDGDGDTTEIVCVVATETNAGNGTPARSNTAGKGNGQYVKAGAGKGNGQYVTQN